MEFSIIIPVFEERAKIAADIRAACAFLQSNHLAGEIIVVDDGSRDDTATVAQGVACGPEVRCTVIRYEKNRGKGFAIRAGVAAASGKYLMFADSGLCIPYENALVGLRMIQNGDCDLAHGSRKLAASKIIKPQTWLRRFTAKIFRGLAVYWMRVPASLSDTQCGFKIYRGEVARALFGACRSDGFMFDIEIILRARRKGYRIKEFPVEWTCDRDSRLSFTRSPKQIIRELKTIKQTLQKEHA